MALGHEWEARVANVVRSDLLDQRTKGLVEMNGGRRASEMRRCVDGRGEITIIMCLGLGRCMFPVEGDNDGKRVCPFCMFYGESTAHTDKHAHRAAEQFVKGH